MGSGEIGMFHLNKIVQKQLRLQISQDSIPGKEAEKRKLYFTHYRVPYRSP